MAKKDLLPWQKKSFGHFGGCPQNKGWASHFNTLLLRPFVIIRFGSA